MHAYINQLAEHDVVSCLHFFFVAALLLSIQCMSLFWPIIYIPHHSIYSFVLELCSLRRGSRKIHHTWRTQKEWWELLYLKQHHVTYSVQCIHHFYVLAHMWCSAFFPSFSLFSLPLPNPSQTNLFSLTLHSRSLFLLLLRCRS